MTAAARTTSVSLLDISTYLPGEPVSAEYYAGSPSPTICATT